MRAKEIFCGISKQHLKFGRQGNPPFLDVSDTYASGCMGHMVPAAAAAAAEHSIGMPALTAVMTLQ
jgi:hypothetical protein